MAPMLAEFIYTSPDEEQLEEYILLDIHKIISVQDNGSEGCTVVLETEKGTEEYDIDELYPTVKEKLKQLSLIITPRQREENECHF